MTYIIIDNLSSDRNHFSRLRELSAASDQIILVSPYLMTDFSNFLRGIDLSNLTNIHLVTTLVPNSFDQINKISSLISLIEFPYIKRRKIDCQISLDNKLHGKVYIFKKSGNYIAAIITSANFTNSGLSAHHEWGVEISDTKGISQLEQSILSCIEYPNLTVKELYRMNKLTLEFLENHSQAENSTIDLNLASSLLSANWHSQFDDTVQFWFKPIGTSENPVQITREFNKREDSLHFSKQKPTGLKLQDILIAYAVGTTKIISIYRVKTNPIYAAPKEIPKDNWLKRWPWYVQADNLTPTYSTTWSKHNLYKNSLREDYLTLYPDRAITATGSQSLGALNYGKDKLKLDPDFAKFIIDKVVAINNSGLGD